MKTALSTIKQLSADEETRRLAFVRERAAWDEATLLKEAEQRGEGILLQRLLTRRFGALPSELVERIACASKDEIELWGGIGFWTLQR